MPAGPTFQEGSKTISKIEEDENMYLYQAKAGLSAGADGNERPQKFQQESGHG